MKLLSLVLALTFGAAAAAQVDIRYVNPEKFERATTTDDKGMVQWAEYTAEKCSTCKGTTKTKCPTCERFGEDADNCPECKRKEGHEAVCRACAGKGAFPDPLEKVHCPGCRGAGFLLCVICGGGGRLKIGEAKQWSACPGCRGTGAFKCGGCDGERLVDVANLKPSLKDANASTLTKAIAATDEALKQLGAVTPTGADRTARKEVKAIAKALEQGQSVHPAIKRTVKAFEDYMGKTASGSQFQGHEEQQVSAMSLVKGNAEYYLKHQKRMMELCLKRAEANAKVEADNKGK
ncbi:MAG: hypothetical protein ABIP94_03440 [Planctomycetota bacterium]